MRKDEAVSFYGSQAALARALGIAQPSVADWGEFPPDRRQLQIEGLTNHTLKAEPGCLERVLGVIPEWDGVTERRKTDRPESPTEPTPI